MKDGSMNRKEFLMKAGKFCGGSCICALLGGRDLLYAQDAGQNSTPPAKKPRSEARIKFAENWVKRFMEVLDSNLDEETRNKIMMANGKACFRGWIKETNQQIEPMTLKQLTDRVNANDSDDSIRIEGNVIYYQFTASAETGLPSDEGQCLCSLVESKPVGLSSTYCNCSVGYVKEWDDILLGRPTEVELLESVLWGDKRCKFKITVT
jgi:hypothetical protein